MCVTIAALVLCLALVQSQAQAQLFAPVIVGPENDVINRCRRETFATDVDVATVLQSQSVPYTSTGRCMLSCAARQIGALGQGQLGGVMDQQGAAFLALTFFPARSNDLLFQSELVQAVNACPQVQVQTIDPALQVAGAGVQTLNNFNQMNQPLQQQPQQQQAPLGPFNQQSQPQQQTQSQPLINFLG